MANKEWREQVERFMKDHSTIKVKDLKGATTESVRAVYERHIDHLRSLLLRLPAGGGKVEGMTEEQIQKSIKRYVRLAATFEMPK